MVIFWILLGMFLVGVVTCAWSLARAASRPAPAPAQTPVLELEESLCWNCKKEPAEVAGLCEGCTMKLHRMLRRYAR